MINAAYNMPGIFVRWNETRVRCPSCHEGYPEPREERPSRLAGWAYCPDCDYSFGVARCSVHEASLIVSLRDRRRWRCLSGLKCELAVRRLCVCGLLAKEPAPEATHWICRGRDKHEFKVVDCPVHGCDALAANIFGTNQYVCEISAHRGPS